MLAGLLSCLLFAGFWWWFPATPPVLLAYALIALLATLSVPIVFHHAGFAREHESNWLEEREKREHEQISARLADLRAELDALSLPVGVRQADTLAAILNDYKAVVETRFIGKKHSPLTYLSAARQVQKHAVQNLADAVAVGHSLSSISRRSPEQSDLERLERLQQQSSDQLKRLDDLFEQNRKYFDALTDTAVEVANIPSFSAYEKLDTLARLLSLAEIAQNRGKI